MDEVGREAIFLLQSIGLPVDPEVLGWYPRSPEPFLPLLPLSPLPTVQDSLVVVHRAGDSDALDATFYLQSGVGG